MVQELTRQTSAFTEFMFSEQFFAGVTRSKIERLLVAQLAGNTEVMDQRFQASDSIQACAIGARRPVEAVNLR
jgi:hypothetical protein